jgi:hypothetical protein
MSPDNALEAMRSETIALVEGGELLAALNPRVSRAICPARRLRVPR